VSVVVTQELTRTHRECFPSQVEGDCFIYVVIVAIKEITGVDVAFMRPRE